MGFITFRIQRDIYLRFRAYVYTFTIEKIQQIETAKKHLLKYKNSLLFLPCILNSY